jgi:nucleotide-binding universal stress UspA family protein
MACFRQILCPIDFSDFSRHALTHARAIAGQHKSRLTLLHVVPLTAVPYALGLPVVPVSVPAPVDLRAVVESMRHFARTDVETSVATQFEIGQGDVASEILDRAAAMPSDLIVMGTHGRSGFERLVLGSVTEKVIRKAHCPVLTVPRQTENVVAPAPFTRILCAIDFSDTSLCALECALSLKQDTGAHLTLVHVVEVSPAPAVGGDVEERALGAYVAAAAQARAERLQRMVPENLNAHPCVQTVVAIGSAHREILRIAAERASNVIVLGAHGFGVSRFLFGSAAHHIVRQAQCPVLTVR